MTDASMIACPDCGTQAARHNLAVHRAKVHPTASDKLGALASARWKTWVFVGIAVLAVILVGYLAFRGPTGGSPAEKASLAQKWEGKPAPDFTLPNAMGGTYKLTDQYAKGWTLLFLNEGLGCAPCVRQMQDMDKDDARFAALNVHQATMTVNSLQRLQSWAQGANIQHIAVLSDNDLSVERAYETTGRDTSMMPGTNAGHTYLLVDPQGIVRWRADYGPGIMYVDQNDIYNAVKSHVQG